MTQGLSERWNPADWLSDWAGSIAQFWNPDASDTLLLLRMRGPSCASAKRRHRQGCVICFVLSENIMLELSNIVGSWNCSLSHCLFLCGSSFAHCGGCLVTSLKSLTFVSDAEKSASDSTYWFSGFRQDNAAESCINIPRSWHEICHHWERVRWGWCRWEHHQRGLWRADHWGVQ